jgi:hypothetical protein
MELVFTKYWVSMVQADLFFLVTPYDRNVGVVFFAVSPWGALHFRECNGCGRLAWT